MGTITTKDGVEIFFKDWGKGQPIVFSHGWPLSGDDWDTQMLFSSSWLPRHCPRSPWPRTLESRWLTVTTWITTPMTLRR